MMTVKESCDIFRKFDNNYFRYLKCVLYFIGKRAPKTIRPQGGPKSLRKRPKLHQTGK